MEGTKSYVVNSDKSMVILYMNAAVGAKYMTGGSYFGHVTTGDALFAECSALCRVSKHGHSAKRQFVECRTRQSRHSAKAVFVES